MSTTIATNTDLDLKKGHDLEIEDRMSCHSTGWLGMSPHFINIFVSFYQRILHSTIVENIIVMSLRLPTLVMDIISASPTAGPSSQARSSSPIVNIFPRPHATVPPSPQQLVDLFDFCSAVHRRAYRLKEAAVLTESLPPATHPVPRLQPSTRGHRCRSW